MIGLPPSPMPLPERERRWLPSLAVLSLILVIVFGGYVAAGALSEPAGVPVEVAGVVRVAPLSGWQPAGRFTDPPGVRLTRGSGTLDVYAASFAADAAALARQYATKVLRANAERLSVSRGLETIRLRSGIAGVRFSYVGTFEGARTAIEGEVTAVVSPTGAGVVFDGWAPEGLLQYVSDDLHTMILSAEVR